MGYTSFFPYYPSFSSNYTSFQSVIRFQIYLFIVLIMFVISMNNPEYTFLKMDSTGLCFHYIPNIEFIKGMINLKHRLPLFWNTYNFILIFALGIIYFYNPVTIHLSPSYSNNYTANLVKDSTYKSIFSNKFKIFVRLSKTFFNIIVNLLSISKNQ